MTDDPHQRRLSVAGRGILFFSFCLIGFAICALSRARIRSAQTLALAASVTAFVVMIGYAYSVTSLVRVATSIPMALATAVLFVVLAGGLLLVTPSTGIVGSITSATAGGRVLRRMLPPLAIGPLALGWLRLQGELAGWYDQSFGVAIVVVAMVAMGVTLSWATARAVDRGEVVRQRADEAIGRLAHFDILTGLPNRALSRTAWNERSLVHNA